jgi:hypothetical protein
MRLTKASSYGNNKVFEKDKPSLFSGWSNRETSHARENFKKFFKPFSNAVLSAHPCKPMSNFVRLSLAVGCRQWHSERQVLSERHQNARVDESADATCQGWWRGAVRVWRTRLRKGKNLTE